MRKTLIAAMFAALMAMSMALVGCGSQEQQQEAQEPLDLTGTWVQVNKGDDYQQATIEDGAIEIDWIGDNGKTTALYWAGTYAAPTEPCEEYSWESQNDKSKTQNALMASTDDTKQFEYKDGKLSYKVSMLGTTTTMELEGQ